MLFDEPLRFLTFLFPHVQLGFLAFHALFMRLVGISLHLQPMENNRIGSFTILTLSPRDWPSVFIHSRRTGHANIRLNMRHHNLSSDAASMHLPGDDRSSIGKFFNRHGLIPLQRLLAIVQHVRPSFRNGWNFDIRK